MLSGSSSGSDQRSRVPSSTRRLVSHAGARPPDIGLHLFRLAELGSYDCLSSMEPRRLLSSKQVEAELRIVKPRWLEE